MVNLDVGGYTKTLNHRKILRNTQKTTETKRILKPKSGGPSFTFTVACSGNNSPLRQQQIDPNTVKTFNDNLRVLRRFASRESNRPNEASDDFSPTGMCKRAGAYTSSGKIFGDTFLWQEVFWCAIKNIFSLLHSIGIQLIPIEFWLRPHQWCQAAGAPLHHLHQWMMGRCLQI